MDKQLAQQLSELKTQLAAITAAIERIDQKVHEPEPEPQIPLWVKLAGDDSVPLSKVFAASKVWDQDDFDEWTQNWNKTKPERVRLLREALATWEAEISSRQPPTINVKVNSVDAAENIVRTIREFQDFQTQFVDHVRDYDRSTLDALCATDTSTDFRTYYDWINRLLNSVAVFKHKTDEANGTHELYSQYVWVLNSLLSSIDTDVITPLMMIDPDSFDSKAAPPDAQTKHKKRVLNIYKEDLRRAFEYLHSSSAQ